MANQGRELLGEHPDRDRLTCEEVRDPGSGGVTQGADLVSHGEIRDRVSRFAGRTACGCLSRYMGETGRSEVLTYTGRS